MSRHHGPSERERTLPFGITADWTPEQAFAVVELLDELRELIYAHYLHQIQDQLRIDRHSVNSSPLHGLFDPLNRQMLSKSASVGRLEMVCQEMKGIVEHHDER